MPGCSAVASARNLLHAVAGPSGQVVPVSPITGHILVTVRRQTGGRPDPRSGTAVAVDGFKINFCRVVGGCRDCTGSAIEVLELQPRPASLPRPIESNRIWFVRTCCFDCSPIASSALHACDSFAILLSRAV